MRLILFVSLLVGCPAAPKLGGDLAVDDGLVDSDASDADADADTDADADADADSDTDADSDADSDADADADADADSDADSDADADPAESWPYPGDFEGETVIDADDWGEWCFGSMDISVEEDASVSGDGWCLWESGGDEGEILFEVYDGSITADGEIEATVFIDTQYWGSIDKPVTGMHTLDSTWMEWDFGFADQRQYVSFER